MSVVIETTIGDLTVDLFTEERPIACLNFLKLCKLKYYNFNLFHTIEQGFIAQTGDPTGTGDGGSSLWGVVEGMHKRFFEAESLPKIYHTSAGLVSLVSAGKNMVGSQFFFSLGSNLKSLDGLHCVIGEVVEGHDILRKLNEAIVDENFRPYQDIRITHTVVLDDPYPDPRAFQVPSRSPSPTAERLKNGRIAADEDIDDTDGKTMEEIQEMLAEREAKARATILEIVGDLPDAEMAPPENVLFVCKLNPVTTDDDLEIIFSRFGKIKSCEVIRDSKTGDSLQYAFVEFEDQKSCEAAYFKMDNVLIDDRRIHVDFSQSVAKVKWRGKGRGVEGQKGRLDFNNLREGERYSNRTDKKPFRETQKDRRNELSIEERRRAREKRHKAQRETTKSENGHSRHREHEQNVSDGARQRPRDERVRSPDRHTDRKRSRTKSRERGKRMNTRYSPTPDRRHQKRRSTERRRSQSRSRDYRSSRNRTGRSRDRLPSQKVSKAKEIEKLARHSRKSPSINRREESRRKSNKGDAPDRKRKLEIKNKPKATLNSDDEDSKRPKKEQKKDSGKQQKPSKHKHEITQKHVKRKHKDGSKKVEKNKKLHKETKRNYSSSDSDSDSSSSSSSSDSSQSTDSSASSSTSSSSSSSSTESSIDSRRRHKNKK